MTFNLMNVHELLICQALMFVNDSNMGNANYFKYCCLVYQDIKHLTFWHDLLQHM